MFDCRSQRSSWWDERWNARNRCAKNWRNSPVILYKVIRIEHNNQMGYVSKLSPSDRMNNERAVNPCPTSDNQRACQPSTLRQALTARFSINVRFLVQISYFLRNIVLYRYVLVGFPPTSQNTSICGVLVGLERHFAVFVPLPDDSAAKDAVSGRWRRIRRNNQQELLATRLWRIGKSRKRQV